LARSIYLRNLLLLQANLYLGLLMSTPAPLAFLQGFQLIICIFHLV